MPDEFQKIFITLSKTCIPYKIWLQNLYPIHKLNNSLARQAVFHIQSVRLPQNVYNTYKYGTSEIPPDMFVQEFINTKNSFLELQKMSPGVFEEVS